MSTERIIMFDLGGVLVETRGREALQAMLGRTLAPQAIMERWLRSPAVVRFERGLSSPEAFAAEFVAEWELSLGPQAFLEAFAAWVTGFVEGAEALLRRLRARHRVACLSNVNAVHWDCLPDLGQMFDAVFASHLTGLMKPEAAAFEYALDVLGVPAAAVCYFDDLAPNVEAARALGLRAHRVATLAQIERALRAEGLWV